MRLFHVSEESEISQFTPRIPTRDGIDKSKGLVWAINEKCLVNFLTPRECPRVTYHATDKTSDKDILRFFSSSSRHCITIEYAWYERMKNTVLYLYEFCISNFYLYDEIAGYFVSECIEKPVEKTQINNLFNELFDKNIEIKIINNLWYLADEIKKSTLSYSICKMVNAQPRV